MPSSLGAGERLALEVRHSGSCGVLDGPDIAQGASGRPLGHRLIHGGNTPADLVDLGLERRNTIGSVGLRSGSAGEVRQCQLGVLGLERASMTGPTLSRRTQRVASAR
ncbi:unnamed protein product (mitochondrion) [Plasmodiophora brassicae]|uniref:Uncharacterized protein n=1 Tax=Plasmodiophora brassicae TaxID=37360 RepID=A0A3P3YC56_PLABS|nr:unnamed protein product [Plasmodiophora brassicae]